MIALDRLLACALGEASDEADNELVEEHVLSCDECATRFAALVELGPTIGALVANSQTRMPITRTLLERFEAAGLISRRYVLAPGATVPCSVAPGDLYSLVRLEADLRGVTRVDIVMGDQRLPDVPFEVSTGTVHTVATTAWLLTLPTMRIPIRLIAVDDGGSRTLADYTLSHTATVQTTSRS